MSDHPDLYALLAHRRDADPEVAGHLATCDRCRLRAGQLEGEVEAILDPEPPPLSEREIDVLLARALDRPVRARRPWVRLGAWAIAATVFFSTGVFAMMLAQALRAPSPPAPPPPAPAALPPTREAPPPPPAPVVRVAPVAPAAPVAPIAAAPPVAPVAAPPPPPSITQDTLFQDAAAALARGDTVTARVLLEVLVEVHRDDDVSALLLTEHGLAQRVDDPKAAATSFRAALMLAPDGPMAPSLRRWVCEVEPDECD